jgi:hypothetical protein
MHNQVTMSACDLGRNLPYCNSGLWIDTGMCMHRRNRVVLECFPTHQVKPTACCYNYEAKKLDISPVYSSHLYSLVAREQHSSI